MESVTSAKASRKAQAKPSLSSQQLVELINTFLDDRKAIDILFLPLEGKSSIADYLFIASGNSQRHISSMAEDLAQLIKSKAGYSVAIEGMPQSDWVLIDAQEVIIHLFRPEVRAFYNLEKMWMFTFDEAKIADETL